MMRLLSSIMITTQASEIEASKWIPIEEYVEQPFNKSMDNSDMLQRFAKLRQKEEAKAMIVIYLYTILGLGDVISIKNTNWTDAVLWNPHLREGAPGKLIQEKGKTKAMI